MRSSLYRVLVLFTAVTAMATPHAPAATSVRIVATAIAGLSGPVEPAAINNAGAIVGAMAVSGVAVPFLWTAQGGVQHFLGQVDGKAYDINDRGAIVGVLHFPYDVTGFLWTADSGFRDLGSFLPAAINNHGQIAGSCFHGFNAFQRPCLWEDGVITDLGNEARYGVASDVNDRGQVVGQVELDPFVWTRDGGTVILPHPLGTDVPAGSLALSGAGEIAGFAGEYAARWRPDGTARWMPSRTSVAVGADDRGWVAGRYAVASSDRNDWHGFAWGPGGEVVPFGPAIPVAMNAAGAIVGTTIDAPRQVIVWRIETATRKLRIETPNARSRWGLGTVQRLAWSYAGDAPQFQIEISRNSGRTWTVLDVVGNAPGGSQSYYWQVTGPLTSAAKFRVTAVGDPDATDVNDTDVRIVNATIEVLLPDLGQSVAFGSPLTIFFRHTLGARVPVAIEVSGNNGSSWRTVAETRTTGSRTSSFLWTADLTPTGSARVRIRALDGTGARGLSRAFTVTAAAPGAVSP